MNLIDIITRKDRALKEISPGVCVSAQVREKTKKADAGAAAMQSHTRMLSDWDE
jgi:hypothetical protein